MTGMTESFLSTIDRAAAGYQYRHRISDDDPLQLSISMWVYNFMRRQLAGTDPDHDADALLEKFFSARGITAVRLDPDEHSFQIALTKETP